MTEFFDALKEILILLFAMFGIAFGNTMLREFQECRREFYLWVGVLSYFASASSFRLFFLEVMK